MNKSCKIAIKGACYILDDAQALNIYMKEICACLVISLSFSLK